MELEEIKKLIEQDKQERVSRSAEGIQAILKQYNCKLEAMLVIKEQGNQFVINIVAME